MEPLTPNDPLWNVLGKVKPVEPRSDFVPNVVRLARQTPQDHGWLARLKAWWQELDAPVSGLTWAAAAVVTLAFSMSVLTRQEPAPTVVAVPVEEVLLSEADFPLVSEFENEWKNLETMGDLLAVQDTSELTDHEIHLLLY